MVNHIQEERQIETWLANEKLRQFVTDNLAESTDRDFLRQAIDLSQASVRAGAFPVGAVLVQKNEIIATAISDGKRLKDPTSHAEIAAIRDACRVLQTRNLKDVVVYSSLEPCLMCYAAMSWASIPRIVYACSRARVSKMHFEGDHDLSNVNAASRRPIGLFHLNEMEDAALQIIENWEASLKK